VIVTNIATAVLLYPILKRHSEIGAVGYLSARFVECAFILVGLISLLSVVTVRQDLTGAAGTAVGTALVGTYEWSFLFVPGLIAGLGNGLLLGWLMYRSGLVPRRMAVLGSLVARRSLSASSASCSECSRPDPSHKAQRPPSSSCGSCHSAST
jgi:hypothetical protein